MDASGRRIFKDELLLEGQQDFIALWEVHDGFAGEDPAGAPPMPEVQGDTVQLIQELVNEGSFVVGYPDRKETTGFTEISLDAAMEKIEKSYIHNFEDRESWTNIVWLKLTDQGEKLALALRRAIKPWP